MTMLSQWRSAMGLDTPELRQEIVSWLELPNDYRGFSNPKFDAALGLTTNWPIPEAIPKLIRLVESKTAGNVVDAARGLNRMGKLADSALPALRRRLAEANAD